MTSAKNIATVDSKIIIKQTKRWVDDFIIHYNICPFAEKVVTQEKIDYLVILETSMEDCLMGLMEYFMSFQSGNDFETALLIFPNAIADFDDYLDFLAIANQLIEDQELDSEFQLASFHPNYSFEGEDADDAANFTNRSPWPMLHIIRQASIEQGLKFYKEPEKIPERNIELTRKLGAEFLINLRKKCMQVEA